MSQAPDDQDPTTALTRHPHPDTDNDPSYLGPVKGRRDDGDRRCRLVEVAGSIVMAVSCGQDTDFDEVLGEDAMPAPGSGAVDAGEVGAGPPFRHLSGGRNDGYGRDFVLTLTNVYPTSERVRTGDPELIAKGRP